MRSRIYSLLGWMFIVFFQLLVGLLLLLVATFLWLVIDINNLGLFLLVLARFWVCFVAGATLVGFFGLKLRHIPDKDPPRRLLFSALIAVIPLITLIIIWLILNPSTPEGFESSILGTWQPILAFSSLPMAVFGFYLPGWFRKDHESDPT